VQHGDERAADDGDDDAAGEAELESFRTYVKLQRDKQQGKAANAARPDEAPGR
jgi:hypothetical protein